MPCFGHTVQIIRQTDLTYLCMMLSESTYMLILSLTFLSAIAATTIAQLQPLHCVDTDYVFATV